MEKRFGVIAVLLFNRKNVQKLNSIFSSHEDIIIGRMGLPMRDKGLHIISLIVEGDTDRIGSLTGKVGRLEGIQVKSVLTKYREETKNEKPGKVSKN